MNISNLNSKVITKLNNSLLSAPFTIIDVGCSGGVDMGWKFLNDNCNIFAIDPQESEIKRLSKNKTLNNLTYEAYWIKDTKKKADCKCENDKYFNPHDQWHRSSASLGSKIKKNVFQQSNPVNENLTDAEISIDDYVKIKNLEYVDFIKIDCDGGDLEALKSSTDTLSSKKVKAVLVEVNWFGGIDENSNTYHNIDRFLKSYAFQPFSIEINTFSKAALPMPYKYSIFAQTHGGAPVQGDVLFIRDCASSEFEKVIKENWGPEDYLKTVCIFVMFGLLDCAAEILVNKRYLLEKIIDIDNLLDLITNEAYPEEASYKEFMQKFNDDPSFLFPNDLKNKIYKVAPKASKKILDLASKIFNH